MISYEKAEIHFMSEVVTGQSQNGNQWANMTLVVTIPTSQNTFKFIAMRVSGDRIDDVMRFRQGDKVEVGYSVSGREWNGKWFNNVDLVSIKAAEQPAVAASPAQAQRPRGVVARAAQAPAPQYPPQGYAQRPAAPAPQYAQGELDPSQNNDLPF